MAGEGQWLLSAAGAWTAEDDKAWKRQQHRENMVHFRLKKKAAQAQLRARHRELERQLQAHLAVQRSAQARASAVRSPSATRSALAATASSARPADVLEVQSALRELVLEREDLRRENVALRDRIDRHAKLYGLMGNEAQALAPPPAPPAVSDAGSSTSRTSDVEGSGSDSSASRASSASLNTDEGWRVHWEDDAAPSFHYQPLTKAQCDAIKLRYDVRFAARPVGVHVGSMLGWRVERAPLVRDPELQHAQVARVWYTKRVRTAPGGAMAAMERLAGDSWPTLVTPELWAKIHTYSVVSQVLQVVDADTVVLARDIPDAPRSRRVRYLNLVQRWREVTRFGRQALRFAMVVADSPANARAREAEARDDVYWVRFGGATMSLEAVDESHFDVVYDHCACVLSEQHAEQQLVDWGCIAARWEQLVLPSRLLAGP